MSANTKLEAYEVLLRERLEWGPLATFVPNKHTPIYNWYYYKEGFARELVLLLLDELQARGTLLDPFCGSGTTCLAAAKSGRHYVGYDVAPEYVALAEKRLGEVGIRC